MQNNKYKIKIDGALGTMVIEDQPTHSIYKSNFNICKYFLSIFFTTLTKVAKALDKKI